MREAIKAHSKSATGDEDFIHTIHGWAEAFMRSQTLDREKIIELNTMMHAALEEKRAMEVRLVEEKEWSMKEKESRLALEAEVAQLRAQVALTGYNNE